MNLKVGDKILQRCCCYSPTSHRGHYTLETVVNKFEYPGSMDIYMATCHTATVPISSQDLVNNNVVPLSKGCTKNQIEALIQLCENIYF